jgi:hypothetical protein
MSSRSACVFSARQSANFRPHWHNHHQCWHTVSRSVSSTLTPLRTAIAAFGSVSLVTAAVGFCIVVLGTRRGGEGVGVVRVGKEAS